MSRSSTTSVAVVSVALLLAACGGGSGGGASTGTEASTRASTATNARIDSSPATSVDGVQVVSATHGGFQTIVPGGYRNDLAASADEANGIEYAAVGPRVHGFSTNLRVFRAPAGVGDVGAVARSALRRLSQRPAFLSKARRVSSLQALKVGGEPALAVDYQLAGRRLTYHRQVFVIHDGWAYQISDTTVPAQYAQSLRALDSVIRSWRWR